MELVTQNSAIKGYHEFQVRSHKDLEILILATPILLLTRLILSWHYVRLKVHCWGKKDA